MNVQQISVFLENRTGQLAEVTRVLADNAINMCAISIAETTDYGVLRLIVDDTERATKLLLEHGFILSMTPVTVVAVPDCPGGLAPVLEAIAQSALSIEYMYSLFTHREGLAYMVFRVGDEAQFRTMLNACGLHVADKAELGLR